MHRLYSPTMVIHLFVSNCKELLETKTHYTDIRGCLGGILVQLAKYVGVPELPRWLQLLLVREHCVQARHLPANQESRLKNAQKRYFGKPFFEGHPEPDSIFASLSSARASARSVRLRFFKTSSRSFNCISSIIPFAVSSSQCCKSVLRSSLL
jgi:hypothetical protein